MPPLHRTKTFCFSAGRLIQFLAAPNFQHPSTHQRFCRFAVTGCQYQPSLGSNRSLIDWTVLWCSILKFCRTHRWISNILWWFWTDCGVLPWKLRSIWILCLYPWPIESAPRDFHLNIFQQRSKISTLLTCTWKWNCLNWQ